MDGLKVRSKKESNGLAVTLAVVVIMTISGCGGGMLNVKQAFDASTKMTVMEFLVKTEYFGDSTVDLRVPARSTFNPDTRAPKTCQGSCVIETAPLSAGYREIAEGIYNEMRSGLGKPELQFGRWSEVPSKKAAFGITAPDWGKTDHKLIIWPYVSVYYDESIKPPMSNKGAEYSYNLKGSVSFTIWRKNDKGNLEVVRPNMTGHYDLASVSRSVGKPSATPLTIAELEKLMPSSTIFNELREKSLEGVKRFVKELKEAK